jgi:hypothetical protein
MRPDRKPAVYAPEVWRRTALSFCLVAEIERSIYIDFATVQLAGG